MEEAVLLRVLCREVGGWLGSPSWQDQGSWPVGATGPHPNAAAELCHWRPFQCHPAARAVPHGYSCFGMAHNGLYLFSHC